MQIVDCILFSGSSDRSVKAWGIKTKKLHGSYEGHGGAITCSTISKDTLYTGSSDGSIRFWELGVSLQKGSADSTGQSALYCMR